MLLDHIEDESLEVSHHMMRGHYDGAELRPYTGRPGAMDAFSKPSRMGNQLRYRNGVVERLVEPQSA